MNNRKLFSLSYFLGRTFFLGFGFSFLTGFVGRDAWISCMIGIILGTMIIFLLQKLKQSRDGTIEEKTQNKKMRQVVITIIFLLFNVFIYSQVLFVFQTFASSFFLIKSPIYYVSLPIPFIIYRICKNGFPTIAKVAEILVPISIFLFFLGITGLIPSWSLDSFTPIVNKPIPTILLGGVFFATYSTTPYFLLMNVPLKKNNFIPSYLVSTATVLVVAIAIIGILGPNLIHIYRFPEYMILKKIRIFNFLEKVENIISITWLFDLFTVMAIAGNNIKECLPKKKRNITFAFTLILLHIATITSSINYQEELMLYQVLPIVLGIIEIIMIITFLFLPKKRT